jgi:hypothetical protein
MVEDLAEGEGDGDLVSEEALLPGLMSVWEGEGCRDADISSAELRESLSRRVIPLMVMQGRLWEWIPMLHR